MSLPLPPGTASAVGLSLQSLGALLWPDDVSTFLLLPGRRQTSGFLVSNFWVASLSPLAS